MDGDLILDRPVFVYCCYCTAKAFPTSDIFEHKNNDTFRRYSGPCRHSTWVSLSHEGDVN